MTKREFFIEFSFTLLSIILGKLFLNFSILELIPLIFLVILIVYPFLNLKSSLRTLRNCFQRELFVPLLYAVLLLVAVLSFSYFRLRESGYVFSFEISSIKGERFDREKEEQPLTQDTKPPPAQETTHACKSERRSGFFCSDFSEEKDFEGWENFTRDSENPRMLKINLPKSSTKDNANLWVKDIHLPPEFHFVVVTKLHDDNKGNLTIVYGDIWRCIIGEDNFNAITCEGYYSNKEIKQRLRENTKYLTANGLPLIKPETELEVRGVTTITKEKGIKIVLNLKYFGDVRGNTLPRVDEDFEFEIQHLSFNPLEDKRRFGLGIIDPEDEGIRVEFIKLDLKGAF